MSKGLGALVLIAGVAGLGYWGAKSHAVTMEAKVAAGAEAVVTGSVHPMTVNVSGRDITLTGTADTAAELAEIVIGLEEVPGRRVVNADAVTVLPVIDPYETALSKAADGSLASTGYAPSAAARDTLAAVVPEIGTLPLGHGAPTGWADALSAGAGALAPLDEGSMALTGTTVTLSGLAATPAEDAAARAALDGLDGFETVVAIDVTDPGIVDFHLAFDAADGFSLEGTLPEALGAEGVAAALGGVALAGDTDTTFADVEGLETALRGLGANLGLLDNFDATATNEGLSVAASPLAGLDTGVVEAALTDALGTGVKLSLQTLPAPEDGAERVNAATGRSQVAHGGIWMNVPDFEPTGIACTEAARATVEAAPIRFVTGSAELDPVSLATINEIAGIVYHCTREPGARVTIGGHTDAEGDEAANYALSVARARAVRNALRDRGIEESRMMPVGYGETEPVADNDTEEGRAKNRRTTFDWPE